MNKEILILGAGPSGIASAFELNKENKDFLVIEKNNIVGGLARTLSYGEFKTDIGPHRFFSQNKFLYELIENLLGEHWIKVDRLTRFYIEGKFFLYPIDLKNAISNVSLYKTFRILFDYIKERVKNTFKRSSPNSFEEQIISDFGRTLAELNMLNYTEKIWGIPCSKISTDWAKQRIKGLSLIEVIKKALKKNKKNGPKTLVDQFYYPDLGAGLIYEKIKDIILKNNKNSILFNSYPIKIIYKNKKIVEIIINKNGDKISIKPKFIISSIPITEFINLLEPKPSFEVLEASKNLKFRSHISVFITINKSNIFPDQWIYFPDKEVPFGRIMEPKNFSKKMSPENKTSLLIEYFCWENDEIWNTNKENLFKITIEWLEKLGFLKKSDVIECFIHKEKYAYPLYDLDYKKNLKIVKEEYLKQFENLQLIGRAGLFRYNNQDHALEMGILAARNIINNKLIYNIDKVGIEQKYFERGYIFDNNIR